MINWDEIVNLTGVFHQHLKEAAEIRTSNILVPKVVVAIVKGQKCGKKRGLEAGAQEGSAAETVPMVTPRGELEGAEPSATSPVLCSRSWGISKGTSFLEGSRWWNKACGCPVPKAGENCLARALTEQGPAQAVGVTFE